MSVLDTATSFLPDSNPKREVNIKVRTIKRELLLIVAGILAQEGAGDEGYGSVPIDSIGRQRNHHVIA